MITTSIQSLDEQLGGGIPTGSSVLVSSSPDINCAEFVNHIVGARAEEGGRVVYFVNDKKPASVAKKFNELGFGGHAGPVVFFDGYSPLLGMPGEGVFSSKDPSDADGVRRDIFGAVERVRENGVMLVFDALSTAIDSWGDAALEHVEKIIAEAKKTGVTTLFIFTQWPYPDSLMKGLKDRFDCVIKLDTFENDILFRSMFVVSKAAWKTGLAPRKVPFKVLKPGGV
ncbi:MAG: hypothetical protein NTY90_05535, partial [Candidatus Micrarchaeota archaeon]|nr:hypothetical protein [Candidatus Micrarchaeota archaeon]